MKRCSGGAARVVAIGTTLAAAIAMVAAIAPAGLTTGPLAAPEAQALPYTVQACDLRLDPASEDGRWSIADYYKTWMPVDDCPDSLRFDFPKPMPDGGKVQADIDGTALLSKLKMTLEGGDTTGGALFQVFDSYPMQSVTDLPARAPGDPPQTVTVDLIPFANHVGIRAICTQAECPATESLTVRDLEFTFHDSTTPGLNGPWAGPAHEYGPLKINAWNPKENLSMRFFASDGTTGVRNAQLKLKNIRTWNFVNECQAGTTWTVPRGCPVQTEEFNGSIEFPSLADGQHELIASATDGAGNATGERTYHFAVDRVAPSRISNLSVAGLNQHGWTSEGQNSATWTTVGERTENSTESGVVRAEYDIDPLDGGPDPASRTSPPGGIANLTLPEDGRWELWIRQIDRAGNAGPDRGVTIGRDTDVPDPPVLQELGWINRTQLIQGVVQNWTAPPDLTAIESGICGYAVSYGDDESPGTTPNTVGAVGGTILPASLPEGVNRLRVRTVSCAGLASLSAAGQVRVDSTPPFVATTGGPPEDWSNAPVTLLLEGHDALSGVNRLWYSLDGAAKTDVPADHAEIVVGEGVHTLAAQGFDNAGNESATHLETVRVDTITPQASIQPLDPANPTQLDAAVEDATSGIREARFELSRLDAGASPAERTWRRFGHTIEPPAGNNRQVQLSATLPDEALVDGTYAIRVVATDRAGNVTAGAVGGRAGGLEVTLPVRERPSITAGFAVYKTRCRRVSRSSKRLCRRDAHPNLSGARDPRLVAYGEKIVLTGLARRQNGTPLANANLAIYETPKFGTRLLASEVTTDAEGRYLYPMSPGPTRTMFVRYGGNPVNRTAEQAATLGVAGAASLRITPRRLHVDDRLQFSGRLLSGGVGMPTTGKKVEIQYLVGGKWQASIGSPKTDLKGRFRASHRLSSPVRKRTRLTFRIWLDSEDPWPFEKGASPPVTVTVFP